EPQEDQRPPRSRLVLARAALEELTTRRPVTDDWLLIEAAKTPRVLVPWTRDARALRDSAAALAPHEGSCDLTAAMELASGLLAGKERPTIVVLSDGAAGRVDKL